MAEYATKELAERLMADEACPADIVDDRFGHDGRLIEDWFGDDENGHEVMWYSIHNAEHEREYMTRDDAVSRGLRVDWV